jgi:hypothetical protein
MPANDVQQALGEGDGLRRRSPSWVGVSSVMPEPGERLETLAARLAWLRGPVRGWDSGQVSTRLRAYGVMPRQLWRGGINVHGVTRAEVAEAICRSRIA